MIGRKPAFLVFVLYEAGTNFTPSHFGMKPFDLSEIWA